MIPDHPHCKKIRRPVVGSQRVAFVATSVQQKTRLKIRGLESCRKAQLPASRYAGLDALNGAVDSNA